MVDWELIVQVTKHLWPGLIAAAIFALGIIIIHLLPKYKWLAAAILLIIITPVALPGFWFSSADLGVSDWDLYFTYYHQLRRTITEFHEFPLWNPWMCGGGAALGDPEFPIFSPIFTSILAFGVETGFKLNIYIVTAIGALGMLALGKRLGLSVYAALVAALGVAFGSVNLLEVVEGHPNIFSAMWIPWIFWSWLSAYRATEAHSHTNLSDLARGAGINNVSLAKQDEQRKKIRSSNFVWVGATRWPIICGLFLALTFFQGGIYLLSYTMLAFLVLILLAPSHKKAFFVTLKIGLWALGFASIKLIPTILWLRQFQDESYASSTYTISHLHKIFFGRYLHGAGGTSDIIPDQGSGWHEYGAYIGPFIAALAALGLARVRKTRVVPALAIAVILAIIISSAGPILKPIFDRISFIPRSNISRIILFAVIPISLLAGYGFDLLRQKTNRRWLAAFFAIAILGCVSADLFSLSTQLSTQAFVLPYPETPVSPAPLPIAHLANTYEIRHHEVDYTRAYVAARQGYGTSATCNVLRPKNVVRTIHDQVNFGPVLFDKNPIVHSVDWSPSRVTVHLTALSDGTEVMVNTNYARGWQVLTYPGQASVPADDIQGRVGIRVPSGDHTLTFSYHPRGMYAGIAITGLTILGAVTWGLYTRHRGREAQLHS